MHTYTSIYVHVVFATWSREPFIVTAVRSRLHAYLATTARNLDVADVYAGGYVDHVHLLGRFDPAAAPSALIGQIKQAATHWLHEDGMAAFRWQRGFAAFSVSHDRVPRVIQYIQRQEEHHSRLDFRDELDRLFRAHGVSIEEAHLL